MITVLKQFRSLYCFHLGCLDTAIVAASEFQGAVFPRCVELITQRLKYASNCRHAGDTCRYLLNSLFCLPSKYVKSFAAFCKSPTLWQMRAHACGLVVQCSHVAC